MLIPTRYKSKIGFEFSYPVGAELLSEALGDTPQAKDMTIWFRERNWLRGGKKIAPGDCYAVLELSYRKLRPTVFMPRAAEGRRHLGPRWSLYVSAVPRKARHLIRQRLEIALPMVVRPWLLAQKDGAEGSAWLILEYNPGAGQLTRRVGGKPMPRLARQRDSRPVATN